MQQQDFVCDSKCTIDSGSDAAFAIERANLIQQATIPETLERRTIHNMLPIPVFARVQCISLQWADMQYCVSAETSACFMLPRSSPAVLVRAEVRERPSGQPLVPAC
jgi:hypothetical protein